MITMPHLEGVFETPSFIFTLAGNTKSEAVINALTEFNGANKRMIFAHKADVEEYFRTTNASPAAAVVLFDCDIGARHFHPTCRNRRHEANAPDWTVGTQWIVVIGKICDPRRCARQIAADFSRNFLNRLAYGNFPWGQGKMVDKRKKLHEIPPQPISMPITIQQTIANLNAGPDLAAAIADTSFAAELPKGSKISWIRVVPQPLEFNGGILAKVLSALRLFEETCNKLVHENSNIHQLLLAGVDLPPSTPISQMYLFPRVDKFSVGRPDLHYTGQDEFPFASEIDEMPGGMPELVHIDDVYGINKKRWLQAFDWLCQNERLLFLVSHEWSKCYIPETKWLVGYLKKLGYRVDILTTDRIDEIEFRNNGLYSNGEKIGTIWRQFPIFETKGRLVDVVTAAYEGRVRLIPEFSHFGNKSWFSVFRSHEAFYRRALCSDTLDVLDRVLPHSYIVGADGKRPFPFRVSGIDIESLDDLKELPQDSRDKLVLKICGANNLAARSYGVLMGIGIERAEWKAWIDKRTNLRQPFVVQRRVDSGVGRIPVMNTKTGYPELFSCRILARPWSFNGELISVHGCAVPSYLYRVHGMVDMAVVPFII